MFDLFGWLFNKANELPKNPVPRAKTQQEQPLPLRPTMMKVINPDDYIKYGSMPAPQMGTHNNNIQQMQSFLQERGWKPKYTPAGVYGMDTEKALKQFQKNYMDYLSRRI